MRGLDPRERNAADCEALRRRYLPRRVRLLLIGEAPPASGRFFYAGDSALFRIVRDTFGTAFPSMELVPDFLEAFRASSCALVDLCDRPVDDLDPAARRARCRASEPRLAREIATLKPRAIVTIVRSIEPNVRRSIASAGWEGAELALPYPGRWIKAQTEFVETLAPALRRWSRTGLLPILEG